MRRFSANCWSGNAGHIAEMLNNADRALLLVLLATAAFHVAFELAQPSPQLFGDELHYLELARADVRAGQGSLLPGKLRVSARPEFYSRFVSQFVSETTATRDVIFRVALVQLVLLLGVVAMVYRMAQILELSGSAALVSAAGVAGLPWFGFHVHSLWPEVLHAFFFCGVVLAALLYLRRGQNRYLVTSGLLCGLAMLTKGVVQVLLPVLLVAFAAAVVSRNRPALFTRVVAARAMLASGIFAASLLCVIGPQLARTASQEGGARLASNRWWNLEIGLTVATDPTDPKTYSADQRWLAKDRLFEIYKSVPIGEREVQARRRTLSHLAATNPLSILGRQLAKLTDLWIAAPTLIVQRQATLEQALGLRARWGTDSSSWSRASRVPARWAWRLLFPLGLLGLVWLASRESGGLLVLSLALVFLLAALAVPLKVRLLLPVVPLLALGLGALVDLGRSRFAGQEQDPFGSAARHEP